MTVIKKHFAKQALLETWEGSGDWLILEVMKRPIVVVYAMTEDGEVLTVEQFRPGAEMSLMELPGGIVNSTSEDHMVAGLRELLEETGYKPDSVVPLAKSVLWFEPGSLRSSFAPFLARGCKRVQDSDGEVIVKLVPRKQWLFLILNGEVLDAKSIVATFLGEGAMR